VPLAVVFLLRAVVLVLLWGFVIAAIVAVRHDVFDRAPRPAKAAPAAPAAPAPVVANPPKASKRAGRRAAAAAATRLAVIDGPSAGTSVPLSSLPVTIGRADDATIVLVDDYVSNHHARLVPRGKEWLVEDTGSTNGTFIGDSKVTAPTVVGIGTRIKIGRNILELQS
jgi:pSer/pThr/pTyr-binding forkhead associated (FHA) protein